MLLQSYKDRQAMLNQISEGESSLAKLQGLVETSSPSFKEAVAEWLKRWIPDSDVVGTNPPIGHHN